MSDYVIWFQIVIVVGGVSNVHWNVHCVRMEDYVIRRMDNVFVGRDGKEELVSDVSYWLEIYSNPLYKLPIELSDLKKNDMILFFFNQNTQVKLSELLLLNKEIE